MQPRKMCAHKGNTNAEHEEIRIEKIPTISAGN